MTRRLILAISAAAAMLACGGGSSGGSPGTQLSDADLYTKAVQDYNAKAYTTAKSEFQEILSRASATAYYDKSTIYVAAIDFHQGYAATCLAVLGSSTPPVSGFFLKYPTSTEMDRARYWHGRCEMGITPPEYLTARADFTAVIGMPAGTYTDNSYYWRGRTYYGTALASPDLDRSSDWSSALSDFDTVVSSFGNGTVAPEAKYWMGRTHFSKAQMAKSRGTQAGDAVAQTELDAALTDLNGQLTGFPGNAWVPDVNVYIGRSHFELADWAADKVAAYTTAKNDLSPWLGTTAAIRDDANYWYGRAIYEIGGAWETAATPNYANAKTQYEAARGQFHAFQTDATLSTSKLTDNASYWEDRCVFSLADLIKTQADALVTGATYANAQAGFSSAQAALAATKSNAQFATSNVLDWVQLYLARSQFEQGYCADKQAAGSGASLYAAARDSLSAYFTQFGSTPPSAAAAHYWLGRTYYAQGNLASAITELDAVVTGWDWLGISSSTKPTTAWWDNAYYYLVRAYSDQPSTSNCSSAQTAYGNLKTAIPSDPFVPQACAYMTNASRCPGNSC